MNRNVASVLLVAAALALVAFALGRMTGQRSAIDPFKRVQYVPQANGDIYAEVWVVAPNEYCGLEGDEKQNVVFYHHELGRTALPDRVPYVVPLHEDASETGELMLGTNRQSRIPSPDAAGYVRISIYHLLAKDGVTEIAYYKKRFARRE